MKKAVVITNTTEQNFTAVLSYHSRIPMDVLFLSAKKHGKGSIGGALVDSPDVLRELFAFLED